MGEDDVFVLESIAEAKKNEEDKLRVTLILSLKDSMPALTKVLKIIEASSTYACTLQLLLGFHKVVCMGMGGCTKDLWKQISSCIRKRLEKVLFFSTFVHINYSKQKSSFLLEQPSSYFDYKIELFWTKNRSALFEDPLYIS